MKIFLVGFMGCGKSTMGRKLAAKLGYEFIDLDHLLEMEIGIPIGSYFAAHGEETFRKLESKILQEFSYPANSVVATGGGTPCYFDNMDWMNSQGTTIYIEMPPVALAKRLEKGKDKRPLIKDLSEAQLISFIEAKLSERAGFYQRAAHTVNGIDLTVDQIRTLLAI